MKISVASSWCNEIQPQVVNILRGAGYTVYDFRHPSEDNAGFSWAEIDSNWESWTNEEYLTALNHPIAVKAFHLDITALYEADCVIMVMPCGNSSHLELGHGAGQNKHTAILLENERADLMYKMADLITPYIMEIVRWIKDLETK